MTHQHWTSIIVTRTSLLISPLILALTLSGCPDERGDDADTPSDTPSDNSIVCDDTDATVKPEGCACETDEDCDERSRCEEGSCEATPLAEDAEIDEGVADMESATPDMDMMTDMDMMPNMDMMTECRGAEGCACDEGERCDQGLTCVEGACVDLCSATPFALGCECESDEECGASGRCIESSCVECPVGTEECGCDDDERCDEGLVCDQALCIDCGQAGEACCADDDAQCAEGLSCDEGICRDLCVAPPFGAACACQVNSDCDRNLRCFDEVCTPCPSGEERCACGVGRRCADGLSCEGSACLRDCGEEREACCPDTYPARCGEGLTCEDELCVVSCGGDGEICCGSDRSNSSSEACDDNTLRCNAQGQCEACSGELGCACDEGSCREGSCVLDECVVCNGQPGCPCVEGQCVDGLCDPNNVCVACEGQTGCECARDSDCQAGLDCVTFAGQSLCFECVGQEGCVCEADGSCNQGLTCIDAQCVVPPCPVGTAGCPCNQGGCNGFLNCREPASGGAPLCESCMGEIGCYCTLAGDCEVGGECIDDFCVDCLDEVGCSCDPVGGCDASARLFCDGVACAAASVSALDCAAQARGFTETDGRTDARCDACLADHREPQAGEVPTIAGGCVSCVGELGCSCDAEGRCDRGEGLFCDQGQCAEITISAEDCAAQLRVFIPAEGEVDSACGACLADHREPQAGEVPDVEGGCVSCLGELGCSCDAEDRCLGDAYCHEGTCISFADSCDLPELRREGCECDDQELTCIAGTRCESGSCVGCVGELGCLCDGNDDPPSCVGDAQCIDDECVNFEAYCASTRVAGCACDETTLCDAGYACGADNQCVSCDGRADLAGCACINGGCDPALNLYCVANTCTPTGDCGGDAGAECAALFRECTPTDGRATPTQCGGCDPANTNVIPVNGGESCHNCNVDLVGCACVDHCDVTSRLFCDSGTCALASVSEAECTAQNRTFFETDGATTDARCGACVEDYREPQAGEVPDVAGGCINCLGEIGCSCLNGECAEGSVCNTDNICVVCEGQEGCLCARGQCDLPLNCRANTVGELRCELCIGEINCYCDINAECSVGSSCNEEIGICRRLEYWPIVEPMTWSEASTYCSSYGGKLADASDLSETDQIYQAIQEYPQLTRFVWIGGSIEPPTCELSPLYTDIPDSESCVEFSSQNIPVRTESTGYLCACNLSCALRSTTSSNCTPEPFTCLDNVSYQARLPECDARALTGQGCDSTDFTWRWESGVEIIHDQTPWALNEADWLTCLGDSPKLTEQLHTVIDLESVIPIQEDGVVVGQRAQWRAKSSEGRYSFICEGVTDTP